MQGTIIGGGIGGLTTAIALSQRGMRVRLYGCTPGFAGPHTGLILTARAMRILDRMQLAAEVYAGGQPLEGWVVTDQSLKELSTHQCPGLIRDHGFSALAIHRADLYRILTQHLGPAGTDGDKICQAIGEQERQVTATFEDGDIMAADYLLGADGVRSRIRGQLFAGTAPRNIPQLCWRGALRGELPAPYRHQVLEAWGHGRLFTVVQTSARELYWYALLNKHPGDVSSGQEQKQELLGQFGDFAPLVQELISQTAESELVRGKLADLQPLKSWHAGRVCLLGDAAHAMTPHLGQGAGQAIEDAWVMAAFMDEYKHPTLAFSAFQQSRKNRVDRIGRLCYRLGQWSQYENGLLVGLRNRMLKRMIRKEFHGVFADDPLPE